MNDSKVFYYNNVSVSILMDNLINDPYIKMEYGSIVRRIDTSMVELQDYLPMVRKKIDENLKSMISELRRKKIKKLIK